jgi:hypothetical protein
VKAEVGSAMLRQYQEDPARIDRVRQMLDSIRDRK